MSFLGDVITWFTTGSNWTGDSGIPQRLGEHLWLSFVPILIALAIALPIGLVLGHLGRGGFLAVNVSNIGRAVPSFALLVLGQELFGLGNRAAYLALVGLAVPPIVTNTYVGIRQVDADVREAARGMGMSGRQLLVHVEAPVALPLIMAGVRTASVQVVATATLAAVVGSGGLGRYIVFGLSIRDHVVTFAGALLVAVLSVLTEVTLAMAQRAVTPGRWDRHRGQPLAPPMPSTATGM